MNTDILCKKLNVTKEAAISKARELYRLSLTKVPSLKEAEVCRSAACVEMACQAADAPVDHREVARFSMAPEKIYNAALVTLRKALNIQPRLTTKEICIHHGCTQIEEEVRKTLLAYRDRFSRTVSHNSLVDFSRPVFVTCAFYLIAKKNNVRFDRKTLLIHSAIAKDEFEKILASMTELCPEAVKQVKPRGPRAKKEGEGQEKEKADADTLAGDLVEERRRGGEGAGAGAGPSLARTKQPAKKKRRALEAAVVRERAEDDSDHGSCSEDEEDGREEEEGRRARPATSSPARPAAKRARKAGGGEVPRLIKSYESVKDAQMLRKMTLGLMDPEGGAEEGGAGARPRRKAAPQPGALREEGA